MGGKPDPEATYGNDEQAAFARRAVNADNKFRALMMRSHEHLLGTITKPSTEQPRYVALRGIPISRGGSPGAMCADVGSREGRGQRFVSHERS